MVAHKNKSTESSILKTIDSLRANGFDVWFANNQDEAVQIFWDEIFSKIKPEIVSWGDSLTLHGLDIISKLQQAPNVELIEPFGENLTWREQINNRKKALSSDLFLTGTNAITTKGQLVNLDMIGNRIAGIAFGPKKVVIFAGVNKIVENLDAAIDRIKSTAAPQNAKRHKDELKTPCQSTGECTDCHSPQRICNIWQITEKSYPVNRIKIILINEHLGF